MTCDMWRMQAETRQQARPGPGSKSGESGFGEFFKGGLPKKLAIMLVCFAHLFEL